VPAKVNVQLAVGGVGEDGFHALANVFLAVGLYDEVTVSEAAVSEAAGRAGGVELSCAGPDAAQVPLDESNLAARAVRALAARYGVEPAVRVHIAKDIPVAGGMAGGSADAAAALVACDALWGLGADRAELAGIAAGLGSDVPFALLGGAALGRGRGDLLEELPVGGTLHWVFAAADGGLSTPAVYRECDRLRAASGAGHTAAERPAPEPDPAILAALRSGDPAELAGALAARPANDLQAAALSLRPSLAATLETGTAAGALAALVSGSGPTCAFLAKDPEAADSIAAALRASGTCRTVRPAPAPAPGALTVSAGAGGCSCPS
jgi:4-diphosphocytidyl-2-C-methyl-D-erythritol kinase